VILENLGRSFPDRLQHNSVTGELTISHYDAETRERTTEPVPPGSRWVAGVRRIQYGFARFDAGKYEWLLVYAGQPAPEVGDDRRLSRRVGYRFIRPTTASSNFGYLARWALEA